MMNDTSLPRAQRDTHQQIEADRRHTVNQTGTVIRLDMPLLLPGVVDVRDACIDRLLGVLRGRSGIIDVHIINAEAAPSNTQDAEPAKPIAASTSTGIELAQLCLHYDPEQVTLAQVQTFARGAGAEITDQFDHLLVSFRLVGTEDDGRRLETELRRFPGVTAAAVNFAGQVARIEYDRRITQRADVIQALRTLGAEPVDVETRLPVVTPTPSVAESSDAVGWYARNRELAWSLFAGVSLLVGWIFSRVGGASSVSLALYLVAYGFGARDNIGHFLSDIRRGRWHFNIDLLMVVAAVGAAVLGQWVEGALLLFLFSLGHALEHYALGRARHAIAALAELAPSQATVLRDGQEVTVAIDTVRPGDRVVVKPAERIPVDGLVREGRSSVNQAPITGESVPVLKVPDEPVFAGSVNGDGALLIEVTAAIGDRTLDRVITLVAEAETQKAPTQQFTDRFERIFVPVTLIIAVLVIVVPPLAAWWTWDQAFYRAMALLVAASPCALALGTPATVLAGIAQAARRGVLIKGGAHLETLGRIDVFAMDKTGTLTRGEPSVTDVVPSDGVQDDLLLGVAAAVERRSQHPLARAVLQAAEARGIDIPAADNVEAVTGQGVRARVGSYHVSVGRMAMFAAEGETIPETIQTRVARLEAAGRTTMIVHRREGENVSQNPTPASQSAWLGVIGVADEPREGVRETLDALRSLGVQRVVMLTGDNADVARTIGEQVGVDDVQAQLMPEEKVTVVRQLATRGRVAMVGDGVNDAPALAHATVGIAMGGAGTAAALETADIALMSDDIRQLPFAVGLSRRARAIIQQNLAISLGVIVLLIVTTLSGIARIGPAVLVHEGSTLIVIANALRLLTYQGRRLSTKQGNYNGAIA